MIQTRAGSSDRSGWISWFWAKTQFVLLIWTFCNAIHRERKEKKSDQTEKLFKQINKKIKIKTWIYTQLTVIEMWKKQLYIWANSFIIFFSMLAKKKMDVKIKVDFTIQKCHWLWFLHTLCCLKHHIYLFFQLYFFCLFFFVLKF